MRSIFIKRILFILCLIVNYSFCDCSSLSNIDKKSHVVEINNPYILSRFSLGSKDKIFQVYDKLYIGSYYKTQSSIPNNYFCGETKFYGTFKVGSYYLGSSFVYHIDFDMGNINSSGKEDSEYQAYGVTEYFLKSVTFDECLCGIINLILLKVLIKLWSILTLLFSI